MKRLTIQALAGLILLGSSGAWAGEQQSEPAETESSRRGIRVDAGLSDNHSGHDRSIGGAFRVIGSVDRRGLFRVEGGVLAGMPYLGGDAGVDARVPIHSRASLVLRGGGGLLFEDGYVGPFWRYGGGLEWRVNPRTALSVTIQRGGHDGRDVGPHLLMVGLERRFSPR